MYSLFCKNIIGYKKYVETNSYRDKMALPLLLLADKILFYEEKQKESNFYCNLYEIIESAENVKINNRYRKFNVFLRELTDIGLNPLTLSKKMFQFDKSLLLDQLELLRQCMFYTYF